MPPPEEEVAEDEGRARHLPTRELLARFAPLFRPHRAAVATGVGLLVLSVAAEVAGPLALRHLLDVGIARGSRPTILVDALLYAGLFLLGTAATWLQVVVLSRTGLAVVADLKRRLFHHVLGLSLAYFDRHPPGRVMARVEADAERLQALFSEVAVAIVRTALLFAGALAVMLATSWRVTLAILLLAAPVAFLAVRFFRWMRGRYRRVRALVAAVSAFVSEYVQGVPVLQAYGHEERAVRRLADLDRAKVAVERGNALLEYGFWGFLTAVEVVAVILLLHVGSGRLLGPALSVGTLVLFVEYTRRVFWPLAAFSEQISFLQRAFAAADRVFGVLDTPSETPDRPGASPTVPADWRELAFEDVCFDYEGGVRALDHVSFRLRRGERVALVGLSGGGKTTVTHLLLRFYEPTQGRIALDGRDLRDLAQRAWRRRIGLVLQDIHLFPGTIGENLRAFSDDVDAADLERAVRTVGIADLVARQPRGHDALLSEGGSNLSMGERQLLSFARALVHDPDLLVLDEATSSVDPGTERRLQASMDRLLAGRTSLVVAHRLATIVSADRILVLHQGRLVEEGTHAELHARGGVYRDLYDLQFRPGASA